MESRRFTDTRELESCREHIKLLKKAPSHYCRDRSKSQYLEDGIKSHAHLYRLYRDLCLENNRQPARSDKYREIFQHEFNLRFFRPRKDQCDKISVYTSPPLSLSLCISLNKHCLMRFCNIYKTLKKKLFKKILLFLFFMPHVAL